MTARSDNLNEFGNVPGEFTQGVGGWAEYTVHMTKTADTVRHDVAVPPRKVIPVIFLPGVMGSNLRISRKRRADRRLSGLSDNRSWRPDDISKADVITSSGYGGWFKNATPAQRQLIFDPAETEVEYYHYTEAKNRFDPHGERTIASDARHQNIPDSLKPIAPLLGQRMNGSSTPGTSRTSVASAAQVARWRGWSEVYFDGAYGEMLKCAEHFLNNILAKGEIGDSWKRGSTDSWYAGRTLPYRDISQLVTGDPREFGATSGVALNESDLKKIGACWYPVHAMGYNFVKSNSDSAKAIAARIRGLVKGYRSRGFDCDEVVIVTHSMGGLVARALIHPGHGNLLNDKDVSILGIYHGAMPTIGAACAYKRMRFGFLEKDSIVGRQTASVLGINGEHATAILANAPAPLEMMPGPAYGQNWLRVVDEHDKVLCAWPSASQQALESIYTEKSSAWWRLINPHWVNPARIPEDRGGGIKPTFTRLAKASDFLESIQKTFHPVTYASYCKADDRPSYGEIIFKIASDSGRGNTSTHNKVTLPDPRTWTFLTDDAAGTLTVRAGNRVLGLVLQNGTAAGDATVPADRSAQHIDGVLFEHGTGDGSSYEHQNSYANKQVLASMLYSIVQIAKNAKWPKK